MPDVLSRRLAALDGAESALVLASGMAATACTMLALLRSGDHLLVSAWVAPATRQFCEQALPALGVQVSFVDPRETRGWRRALTKTTRAIFIESPAPDGTEVVDLQPARAIAQELGLALIVDATAAFPEMAYRPLADGADVVVRDASLFLSADGAPIGVVCGTESVIDEVRVQRDRWGAVPHPAAEAALVRGLDTLALRAQRRVAPPSLS